VSGKTVLHGGVWFFLDIICCRFRLTERYKADNLWNIRLQETTDDICISLKCWYDSIQDCLNRYWSREANAAFLLSLWHSWPEK